MKTRCLTEKEILALEKNGCTAESWGKVKVSDPFDASKIRSVHFAGEIEIGAMTNTTVECDDGIKRLCGIYNARLHNVIVGDGCSISEVKGWLSNLKIGSNVVIENVGTISCDKKTSFGNGHEIAVFNEGGGRELKITDKTSAQIAYLTVMYRDNKQLIGKLNEIAELYSSRKKSDRGTIGEGVSIRNCGDIRNVCICPYAKIEGVLSLKEGTIDSCKEGATIIGNGVIAEDFVIQKGAHVKDGAMVMASLIGEGSRVGKQFSCENTAMFANCEGFHSEACSWFAGPYSVTHHRSTLLIAAYTSFYNAGSGTNQSNHMYKLGPIHQGILERGSKTGSFSYLLWPSRVGAFTAVMGKHYANFDTSDFPFSYINEEDGKSTITPAMNFFTVGTLRDGEKWPSRDRRKSAEKLDLIIFDVLSPYTAQKMIRGSAILQELGEKADKSETFVSYKGIMIKRLLLKTCRRYYLLALDKYLGDLVAARMESIKPFNLADLFKADPAGEKGDDEWVDIAGMICRKSRIDSLTNKIINGKITTQEEMLAELNKIYASYKADEWNWFLVVYEKLNGKAPQLCTVDEWKAFLAKWKESSLKLLNMVASDASKEFEGATRTGFGIDGNTDGDFEAVRGTFDGNKFVKKLKEEGEKINKRYESIVAMLT